MSTAEGKLSLKNASAAGRVSSVARDEKGRKRVRVKEPSYRISDKRPGGKRGSAPYLAGR